ncbi:hypothetical protein P154DRAFT_63647 [Amniculicola lignicola CBS 123094]|uniref:Uncharacterized protein n=1 Tax=Amniculicola lignicola CBS 123094 TaxID=1392246 RepID=A0A6A5WPZ8_9PLEO|nr:hypothetical protein P154DRAFT_63647 [Amniculicola lignicola CBS 123094]
MASNIAGTFQPWMKQRGPRLKYLDIDRHASSRGATVFCESELRQDLLRYPHRSCSRKRLACLVTGFWTAVLIAALRSPCIYPSAELMGRDNLILCTSRENMGTLEQAVHGLRLADRVWRSAQGPQPCFPHSLEGRSFATWEGPAAAAHILTGFLWACRLTRVRAGVGRPTEKEQKTSSN